MNKINYTKDFSYLNQNDEYFLYEKNSIEQMVILSNFIITNT
jgi:hypothetical protein